MKISRIFLFLVLSFYLAACENEPENQEAPVMTEPVNQEEKVNQNNQKPQQTKEESQQPITLTDYIQEIHFFQMDEQGHGQQGIYEFTGNHLPSEPAAFALHKESVFVWVKFDTTDKQLLDQLLEMINIKGASGKKIELSNAREATSTRYRIILPQTEDEVTFRFGELPLITLVKQNPLKVSIDPEDERHPNLMFKEQSRNESITFPNYIIANKADTLLLHFSEPMDTNVDITDFLKWKDINAVGKWLNDQTYQLQLTKTPESFHISFRFSETLHQRIKSQSGNYPSFDTIDIERIGDKTWKNIDSGERVGWSKRDRFYDFLLFSPDRSSYFGIVEIARGQGDAEGSYYGFVLEPKNRPPKIVVSDLYTNVLHKGVPVQWINNQQILYSSPDNVYKMNVDTGERQMILGENQHNGRVNQFAYNPFNQEIYVFIGHYKKDYQHSTIDRWIYSPDQSKWIQEKNYSEMLQEGIYYSNKLSVHPTSAGVLWTKGEDGKVYTIYELYNGKTRKVRGEVVLQTEHGVYLKTFTGKHHDDIDKMFFWDLTMAAPTQIPDPPGYVSPFGSHLISYEDYGSADYFLYDAKSGKWVQAPEAYREIHPQNRFFQEIAPIYKK